MKGAEQRAEFRSALRENAADLLAYLERRTSSREDAADLLGETMLHAWRRFDAFPEDATSQRMWLYGIARNVLANFGRSRKRRTALADRLRSHMHGSEITPDVSESSAVRDAVRRLPEGQRELVMLVHWDGLTVQEAAALLGLNPSTARSRYAGARETLRVALMEDPALVTSSTTRGRR